MVDTSTQRREIVQAMKSCMGINVFEVIRNDELRYELKVRSRIGSYVMVCLDKSTVGEWGRITFEMNCYTKMSGKPFSIIRRFFTYGEALAYFIRYKLLIRSLIHLFIEFEEEARLLEKS